ncbi:hypothetical protein Bca4012_067017 [Brassica carinata]
MGVTKTQLAFLVLVVFVTFLSNHNVSAAVTELEKFSYDHCSVLCSNTYGWHECWSDCGTLGYRGAGECASPSPNVPKKCCCQP